MSEDISKDSSKSRDEITFIRKQRVILIQPLLDQGKGPTQISNELNINITVVHHLIRRYCKRPDFYKPNSNLEMYTSMDWQSVCDPSTLTSEQREDAAAFGIEEGRYAWLLTCPKGGNTSFR